MNNSRLPFTRLQAFEAVARLGSFSAARDEPEGSNVSRHVSDLETELEVRLIQRSPRGKLTPEGRLLAAHLTASFAEIRQVLGEISRSNLDADSVVAMIQRRERLRGREQQPSAGGRPEDS